MKYATKEQAMKWLDDKIKLTKKLAVDLHIEGAEITVAGTASMSSNEMHLYKARNVQKLAELLEIPFEVKDHWCEQYPELVEVSFVYNGCRFYGLDDREEYYNEKTEVAD